MKQFVLSMVLCLGLLTLTAWLLATPAYAAEAKASCGPGGGSITCTGIQCSSVDASPSGGGRVRAFVRTVVTITKPAPTKMSCCLRRTSPEG